MDGQAFGDIYADLVYFVSFLLGRILWIDAFPGVSNVLAVDVSRCLPWNSCFHGIYYGKKWKRYGSCNDHHRNIFTDYWQCT